MKNNRKVYVGNLSFSLSEEALEEEFSKCGEIEEVKLISDMQTGRSKGFAFITFKTEEGMQEACKKNGEELQGRALRVNEAEDRRPKGRSSSFGSNRSDY
ncbi:MAG: RNA-binding protein [bacterium]